MLHAIITWFVTTDKKARRRFIHGHSVDMLCCLVHQAAIPLILQIWKNTKARESELEKLFPY